MDSPLVCKVVFEYFAFITGLDFGIKQRQEVEFMWCEFIMQEVGSLKWIFGMAVEKVDSPESVVLGGSLDRQIALGVLRRQIASGPEEETK